MNAKHIESRFAAMGARLKVREIASRWQRGDRKWIDPVRRLLREQDQAGALPAALTIFRDAKSRCRQGLHRPGCGGSTPPSRRVRVASIAAMQWSLKPQSTGQHRGNPPFRRRERGLKNL